MIRAWSAPLRALLDLVYGERCLLCAAARGERAWTDAGPRVRGLRPWDTPHLCRACADALVVPPVRAHIASADGAEVAELVAARREDAVVVHLVGGLKYHGLRGLAWPLARLMTAAARDALATYGPVDVVVPVPLHRRRYRQRGFNQAEVLARLVGRATGLPVVTDSLARRRRTDQQASCDIASQSRTRNVAGAFSARPPAPNGGRRVALVDDLVTTGATWAAAAQALRERGWDVRWGLALGAAARLGGGVSLDTSRGQT